ncbi:hypothetical protein D1007_57322 [Hordeum vulgare]|nr:hypothetical protein D1007_57322 [Hordeum vulgare]
MAEAHGDAGEVARDVVKLQGVVTMDEVKDVGGVHGGAEKLATATDVEKEVAVSALVLPEQKVMVSSDAVHPDTRDAQPGEEEEYDSGEDVYKGNFKSFKAKEVEMIKVKGVASFFNRKIKKWRCPYCITKPKPEDVANRREDYMIRGSMLPLRRH